MSVTSREITLANNDLLPWSTDHDYDRLDIKSLSRSRRRNVRGFEAPKTERNQQQVANARHAARRINAKQKLVKELEDDTRELAERLGIDAPKSKNKRKEEVVVAERGHALFQLRKGVHGKWKNVSISNPAWKDARVAKAAQAEPKSEFAEKWRQANHQTMGKSRAEKREERLLQSARDKAANKVKKEQELPPKDPPGQVTFITLKGRTKFVTTDGTAPLLRLMKQVTDHTENLWLTKRGRPVPQNWFERPKPGDQYELHLAILGGCDTRLWAHQDQGESWSYEPTDDHLTGSRDVGSSSGTHKSSNSKGIPKGKDRAKFPGSEEGVSEEKGQAKKPGSEKVKKTSVKSSKGISKKKMSRGCRNNKQMTESLKRGLQELQAEADVVREIRREPYQDMRLTMSDPTDEPPSLWANLPNGDHDQEINFRFPSTMPDFMDSTRGGWRHIDFNDARLAKLVICIRIMVLCKLSQPLITKFAEFMRTGLPAGETVLQQDPFEAMLDTGFASYCQPSVSPWSNLLQHLPLVHESWQGLLAKGFLIYTRPELSGVPPLVSSLETKLHDLVTVLAPLNTMTVLSTAVTWLQRALSTIVVRKYHTVVANNFQQSEEPDQDRRHSVLTHTPAKECDVTCRVTWTTERQLSLQLSDGVGLGAITYWRDTQVCENVSYSLFVHASRMDAKLSRKAVERCGSLADVISHISYDAASHGHRTYRANLLVMAARCQERAMIPYEIQDSPFFQAE